MTIVVFMHFYSGFACPPVIKSVGNKFGCLNFNSTEQLTRKAEQLSSRRRVAQPLPIRYFPIEQIRANKEVSGASTLERFVWYCLALFCVGSLLDLFWPNILELQYWFHPTVLNHWVDHSESALMLRAQSRTQTRWQCLLSPFPSLLSFLYLQFLLSQLVHFDCFGFQDWHSKPHRWQTTELKFEIWWFNLKIKSGDTSRWKEVHITSRDVSVRG